MAPGLRLRVRASGAKSWTLRYRSPKSGDRIRVTIGNGYPATPLAEARRLALIELGKIGRGVDPRAAKQIDREALRVVDLFGEDEGEDPKAGKLNGWYLSTYVQTAGKIATAKTAKGIANDRSYIRTHLRPRKPFMAKRADEVKVGDLNAIKAATSPGSWRKLRNILHVAFEHAIEVGAIEPGTNPVTRTKAASDRRLERYLTPAERVRLESALASADELGPEAMGVARGTSGGLSHYLVLALRLLVLTGMRRGDVLALRWEHCDWRHAIAKLPVGKTGGRDVPLSPQAVAFLRSEQRRGGTARAMGFVVATPDGGAVHPENIGRAWRSIRKAAKLDGVRLHDLRHSWASDAVSAGVPLYVVGAALGHRQPNTTARYAHLHDKAIQDGLAKAGDAIESATKGGES